MATKKLIDLDLLTSYDTKIKSYITSKIGSSTGSGVEVYTNYSLLPTADVDDKTIAYCEEDYVDANTSITHNKGFYEYKDGIGWKIIGGSENLIESISVNGTTQTITNKNVDITVPTKTSDLTNDSNFVDNTKIATQTELGLVKVDSSTIVIQDGTISANINNLLDDTQATNDKTYSSNKIENDFTKQSDVLTLNNTAIYTPTNDYHPVTKKYVDDAISAINGMKLIDRVNTVSDLPSDANEGDVYYVGLASDTSFDTYVKLNNGNWLKIGSTTIDMNNYYNKNETNSLLKAKISVCNTLPTASIDYNEQCYFNIFDGCIYQCILDGSDYKWNKLVSNESYIHKGNDEPTDKSKLWIDTSDSTKILIKTYDEASTSWKVLNDIPTQFIKNITYINGKLTITHEDNTETEISITGTSGVDIKKSDTNGNILVNEEEIKVYDDTNVMKKEDYISHINEGNVKISDKSLKIDGIELSQPDQYYGKNNLGEIGFHYLPVNITTVPSTEQRSVINAIADQSYIIPTNIDLTDCKLYIQCIKAVDGLQDVQTIIDKFDKYNKDKYICNNENITFDDSVFIKNNYIYNKTINDNGFYETNEIDKTQFENITEVIING